MTPVRKVTKPTEPEAGAIPLECRACHLLGRVRKEQESLLYDVFARVVYGHAPGRDMNPYVGCRGFPAPHDHAGTYKDGEAPGGAPSGVYNALWERNRLRRIDSPYVFPARLRYGKEPKPIEIQNAWLVALKRADIKNFRFHDLRHSAASYLAMNGVSLPEIAAVLGHKTLAMVQRYAHLSDARTSKVVERMNQAIFGGESEQREQGGSQ